MNPLPARPSTALAGVALALLLAVPAFAAPKKDDLTKPLKTLVSSVRYGKFDSALKLLAVPEQAAILTGDDWAKASDAQKKEFQELFQTLFSKIAFPRVQENFKHLDSVTYDAPELSAEGNRADVGSIILINHPLKKQELKLRYSLVKEGKAWKVLDVKVLGDSMLEGIREGDVKPLLKDGGWEKLLTVMRGKAAELKDAKSK